MPDTVIQSSLGIGVECAAEFAMVTVTRGNHESLGPYLLLQCDTDDRAAELQEFLGKYIRDFVSKQG